MPNPISTLFSPQQMTDTAQIADITVKLDALHSAYSEILAQAQKTLEDFEFNMTPKDIEDVANHIMENGSFTNRVVARVLSSIRSDLVSFRNSQDGDIPNTYRVAVQLLTERVSKSIDEAAIDRLKSVIDNCLADEQTQAKIDKMFRVPPEMEELKVKASLWDTMIEGLVTANLSVVKAVEEGEKQE